MARWIMRETDANIKLMSEVLKISETASLVLANREIRTKNTAIRYLNPLEEFFFDTKIMKDLLKGIEIVTESIKRKERIVIYGDYDVGATRY